MRFEYELLSLLVTEMTKGRFLQVDTTAALRHLGQKPLFCCARSAPVVLLIDFELMPSLALGARYRLQYSLVLDNADTSPPF